MREGRTALSPLGRAAANSAGNFASLSTQKAKATQGDDIHTQFQAALNPSTPHTANSCPSATDGPQKIESKTSNRVISSPAFSAASPSPSTFCRMKPRTNSPGAMSCKSPWQASPRTPPWKSPCRQSSPAVIQLAEGFLRNAPNHRMKMSDLVEKLPGMNRLRLMALCRLAPRRFAIDPPASGGLDADFQVRLCGIGWTVGQSSKCEQVQDSKGVLGSPAETSSSPDKTSSPLAFVAPPYSDPPARSLETISLRFIISFILGFIIVSFAFCIGLESSLEIDSTRMELLDWYEDYSTGTELRETYEHDSPGMDLVGTYEDHSGTLIGSKYLLPSPARDINSLPASGNNSLAMVPFAEIRMSARKEPIMYVALAIFVVCITWLSVRIAYPIGSLHQPSASPFDISTEDEDFAGLSDGFEEEVEISPRSVHRSDTSTLSPQMRSSSMMRGCTGQAMGSERRFLLSPVQGKGMVVTPVRRSCRQSMLGGKTGVRLISPGMPAVEAYSVHITS